MKRKKIEIEKTGNTSKVWLLDENGMKYHLLASVSIPEEFDDKDIFGKVFIRLDYNEITIRG